MFSDYLFRRRASATGKKPAFPWHDDVLEVWRQTVRKAELQGDPFSYLRKQGELPAVFEYGMNCFIDRVFETEGKDLAQQAFEEMKNSQFCRLRTARDCFDVPGVPVLFNISSISDAVSAVSRVATNFTSEKFHAIRRSAMNIGIYNDEPILPPDLPINHNREYAFKMGVLSIALEARSAEHGIESPQILALYSTLVTESLPVADRELDDADVMWALWLGNLLSRIIPGRVEAFQKFLKQLSGSFWQMLWTDFLDYFNRYYGSPLRMQQVDVIAGTVETEKQNQYRALNDEEYWNYAYRRFNKTDSPGEVAALIASAVILKRRTQHPNLTQAVREPDSNDLCRFLLRKCYDQEINTV
jgi:hypothetical protein